MEKKKLSELKLEKLYMLYGIVNELGSEFSKMTDNYSLVTGDNKFENIPEEVRWMIGDRQKFVSYKLKLKKALIDALTKEMDKYE